MCFVPDSQEATGSFEATDATVGEKEASQNAKKFICPSVYICTKEWHASMPWED